MSNNTPEMPIKRQQDSRLAMQAFLLSVLVVGLLFLWQGSKGLNLWDEGYLWYGAQGVMRGEVPIRDFMAYDPGRYYWSAAWMMLWGDNGIMSLRLSVAIFQVCGLFVGLLLVARSIPPNEKDRYKYLFWGIVATTLAIWMFPRHKLFDLSISIFQVGILCYLIQRPVPLRYFIAGCVLGVIAVFGRNHGVYGVLAGLGVMFWISIRSAPDNIPFFKGLIFWGTGVLAGYMPVLFMLIAVPEFASAFWGGLRMLFEQNSTNLPLPVPWPWTVNFTAISFNEAIRGIFIGIFFMGIAVFGILGVLWVIFQKLKSRPVAPALVAASFVGLPYMHYAFSRADVGHLAHSIFPLLLGCFAILPTTPRIKWVAALGLCSVSLWIMLPFHPGWQCHSENSCARIEVSGNNLRVDLDTANNVRLLRQLTDRYAPKGENILVVPFWPGAYPLLGRVSPIWEIYALFPKKADFEQKEIERIKASQPNFALIFDFPLDGREELRFKNTHPLINQYIMDNFEFVANDQNSAYKIYRSR
jgi:hypothetical protein